MTTTDFAADFAAALGDAAPLDPTPSGNWEQILYLAWQADRPSMILIVVCVLSGLVWMYCDHRTGRIYAARFDGATTKSMTFTGVAVAMLLIVVSAAALSSILF